MGEWDDVEDVAVLIRNFKGATVNRAAPCSTLR